MNRTIACALMLAMATAIGCQRGEEITTYTTPRTEPPRDAVNYAAVAQQLDHTLAAILPQGNRAWFFKLAGPAPVIDRRRGDFIAFLQKVGPAPAPDALPTWQLPDGWEEKAPTSEFITKVLVVPDDAGPLELTVSSLELSGEWQDFVAKNVNRWLGQLSQGPLDAARIAKLTQQLATAAGPATVIELAGVNQKAPRANPHEQAAQPPAAKPHADAPLVYETPGGWQPGQTSAMRTAAFLIADGKEQAEVTVIALPASAGLQITDVTANVQRWAGQVGLSNLDADAQAKLTAPITIGGATGTLATLLGPENAERPVGLLAAMVQQGDKVWFFKLTGDRALVQAQQPTFEGFLKSVRFQ